VTTTERKLRCLRLVEQTNGIKIKAAEQCPNERLPGSDLCARHLGDAAGDFRKIIGTAREPE
jgi:hypothetical protein